jgi:transposase
MKSTTIWVGLDVHKESISVAVFEGGHAQGRPGVSIPNDAGQIRKLFSRLKKEGEVHACYEAGSCGYEVYRQLAAMGIACDVIAPGLIPVRVGDRVKTDRRDAEKLARLFRAGELTSIRVPTQAEEALRDLIRCREDAREDVLRHRHHVLKFLLRHGRIFRETKHWTLAHWQWLRTQRFEQSLAQTVFTEYLATLEKTLARVTTLDQEIAQQAEKEPYKAMVGRLRCLRGIDTLSAMALIAEVCDFARFEHPRELMAYLGLVPSERSSGNKQRRGGITKTGNSHARRILVEAAWHYRHVPKRSVTFKARWKGQPQPVVDHAFKAQERLHRRYFRLTSRGKPASVAVVAVARELAGFVWAIGCAA